MLGFGVGDLYRYGFQKGFARKLLVAIIFEANYNYSLLVNLAFEFHSLCAHMPVAMLLMGIIYKLTHLSPCLRVVSVKAEIFSYLQYSLLGRNLGRLSSRKFKCL